MKAICKNPFFWVSIVFGIALIFLSVHIVSDDYVDYVVMSEEKVDVEFRGIYNEFFLALERGLVKPPQFVFSADTVVDLAMVYMEGVWSDLDQIRVVESKQGYFVIIAESKKNNCTWRIVLDRYGGFVQRMRFRAA